MVALAAVIGVAGSAQAQQGRQMNFIRDAEIEHIIRTFSRPIFDAAGIDADSVTFALVRDRTINAFVAGGMNIFLYTGLLQEADSPEQLIGVIAHETGHIAGGHLVRGEEAMENASIESILAMIVGVGAAVASGNAGAGMATVLGGQEMAKRGFLAFSRAQEGTADQAALTFLERAHYPATGMLSFFEVLASKEGQPLDSQVGYLRTHPLTTERIDAVRAYLEHQPPGVRALPPAFADQFKRLKAKLMGFVNPELALRRYPASDSGIPARYARAIAYYQKGDLKSALPMIDQLIAQEPANPFFYELKGQVLLENSQIADSIPPYRKSVALLPGSGLLQSSLSQALLESNDPRLTDEALGHLRLAMAQESHSPFVWRLYGTAWDRKHNPGMVAYAMAEEALTRNDKAMARSQAERAEKLLPRGSPAWLRTQDIRAVVGEGRR